jgi:hypothetical protein
MSLSSLSNNEKPVMTTEAVTVSIPSWEMEAAHGGAAVYTNRFLIIPNESGLRIAFLESEESQ